MFFIDFTDLTDRREAEGAAHGNKHKLHGSFQPGIPPTRVQFDLSLFFKAQNPV
jgi:hypothetical protein